MAITPQSPVGEIVKQLTPNYKGIGTILATGTLTGGVISVRIPLAASSSACVWLNPEVGTVLASAYMVWTVAGTGTFDMGVSSDGTSITDNIVNGGTMLAGVYSNGTVSATAVTGVTNNSFQLVTPAGTGTNNSIGVLHNEALTGTAVGFLVVRYSKLF